MYRNFTDPYDELPAYEREIVRLRAFELTLVLYYQEDIQRLIVDLIENHDKFKARRENSFRQRAPKGSKKRLANSLSAMVSDGAISEDEMEKIIKAINFRNDIGHRIDQLFSDLEQERFSGRIANPDYRRLARIPEFDHQAVQNMKQIQGIIDRTTRTHYSIMTFSLRGPLMFSSTEKSLARDIRRSQKKLQSLAESRQKLLQTVDADLKYGFRLLSKLQDDGYFDIRFENGKMTDRGQEFCYQLFDKGLSDIAIAHMFEMRLRSIQFRRKTWQKIGGLSRLKREWDAIPAITTPSRFDD